MAKQGWKQGDQSKGDYNVENEFEKDVNPVVIDYDADDEGKEESLISAFSSNAFDLKTYLEETFEVNIKRIFQPSQERFWFRHVREQRGRDEDVREENDRAQREGRGNQDTDSESTRREVCQRESSKMADQSAREESDGSQASSQRPRRRKFRRERLRRQGRIERVKTNNGGKVNISIHPEKHNERMNARLSCRRSVRAVLFLKIPYLSFLFIIIISR